MKVYYASYFTELKNIRSKSLNYMLKRHVTYILYYFEYIWKFNFFLTTVGSPPLSSIPKIFNSLS